ncbi:SNF2 family N-terminal domain-containing protein [Scenedesmus sp. NREL 46B-D3]|nr:SNF2 family N-terminal domain-containing protein [Scenedesmus sp. NREL 46B-D3]
MQAKALIEDAGVELIEHAEQGNRHMGGRLKQALAHDLPGASAGSVEVLLAYTDQADGASDAVPAQPQQCPVMVARLVVAAASQHTLQQAWAVVRPLLRQRWCLRAAVLRPQPLLHSGLLAVPFQQQGVAWMMARERNPGQVELPPGGILADAMGLGKTVQALLLIVGRASRAPTTTSAPATAGEAEQQLRLRPGGSLILVPKVLLGQWVDELLLKCGADPCMAVCEFTGTTKHGKGSKCVEYGGGATQPKVLQQVPTAEQLCKYPVVLMSYDNFMSEAHRMKHVGGGSQLSQIHWQRVLLDESQRLGAGSSRGLCMAAARLTAASRWCISGTPFASNALVRAGILRLLYGEADDIWLQGMGPDAAELAATGYAVRSLLGKALVLLAGMPRAPRPGLSSFRELAEVQGQHPIPPLHFTVNRIDLLHAHGAVNGLLVLQDDGEGDSTQVSHIFSRAVRAGLHPQALTGEGGAETPMQLLHRAEELLTGAYTLLPVHNMEQQHVQRVAAERAAAVGNDTGAAAAGEAGAAAARDFACGFDAFAAAAGKYEVKQRGMQQLLAKVPWQQLQLQPDAAASQQLSEGYMAAVAAAGKTCSMAEEFHAFAVASAAVHDEVASELASQVKSLPEDAAGWQAVLPGSSSANNAQEQALAAASDAVLHLSADAADQLQQAAQGCSQQLRSFLVALKRFEARTAPAGADTSCAAAAVAPGELSAGSSSAGARVQEQQKRALQGVLRVLASVRAAPATTLPAAEHEAAAAEHERRTEHLAHQVKTQLLAVAAEARAEDRHGAPSLPHLRSRYGCVLAGLADQLLGVKRSNAAHGAQPKQKVVVAVSDRQVMGQVQRLCTELEIPATSLKGRDAAHKLRTFSLPSSASWVLILRLGHQAHEQSAGLTLTCCSRLLVVDTLPREDLLRQLLGRINRFGQQQEQRLTFLVGTAACMKPCATGAWGAYHVRLG